MSTDAETHDDIDVLTGRATEETDSITPKAVYEPVLFFRVGQRWFVVPVDRVGEVLMKGTITRVPRVPRHVLGVTLVHGRLIPVIALEEIFGAVGQGASVATLPRLVVLANDGLEVAVVATETRGVVEMAGTLLSFGIQQHPFIVADVEWDEGLAHRLDVAALITIAARRDDLAE